MHLVSQPDCSQLVLLFLNPYPYFLLGGNREAHASQPAQMEETCLTRDHVKNTLMEEKPSSDPDAIQSNMCSNRAGWEGVSLTATHTAVSLSHKWRDTNRACVPSPYQPPLVG